MRPQDTKSEPNAAGKCEDSFPRSMKLPGEQKEAAEPPGRVEVICQVRRTTSPDRMNVQTDVTSRIGTGGVLERKMRNEIKSTPKSKKGANFEAKKNFFDSYMRSGGNANKPIRQINSCDHLTSIFVKEAQDYTPTNQDKGYRQSLGHKYSNQERRGVIGLMGSHWEECDQLGEETQKPPV